MEKRTTLDDLKEQQRRIVEMQRYLGPLVQQARLEGYSWSQVGAALGMSKQAAHERFGDADAVNSGRPNSKES